MSNNVIDLSSKRDAARHRKKEQNAESLKQRFENALPSEEKDPKKKLLGIFKRKDKKKPKKPTNPGDGW